MKAKLILNLYIQYFEMVICYHIRILGQPNLSCAFQVLTCRIETCVQVFFTWMCLTKCHWMCLIECHCFFQLCAKANWVSHICLFYFMNVQVTKLKSLLHIKRSILAFWFLKLKVSFCLFMKKLKIVNQNGKKRA
jgi:hypothetical protein